MNKLSFPEFLAKSEDEDVEWAEGAISIWSKEKFHHGDCTNTNHSCDLCVLERKLNDYYEYCKENNFLKQQQ